MSSDDRHFVGGQTGDFGYHCPSAQCYGYNEFGHFAQDCPHKIPPSRMSCYHGRSHSKHWYIHTQRDRSHSYYGPRHRDILAGHSPTPIPTMTEATVIEGTPHATLQAMATVNATLQPMNAPHHPLHNDTKRCSHTPSHTHHFSHRCNSCHSMDQRWSHSSNSHHTAQGSEPRKVKQCQDPQPPQNPPLQDCHHPGFCFRFFTRFWQWLWSFILLGLSPSRDKDKWGGNSSNHYTTGLISDFLTVTVHAGKGFKALNSSRPALSLVLSNVYNIMKTAIRPKCYLQ